jgi:hypothetical protein
MQLDGIRLPHIEPFNRLVDEVSTAIERLPYVARQYGGVEARLLALFRDPRPKTQRGTGSGRCIENDDPLADRYSNLWRARESACGTSWRHLEIVMAWAFGLLMFADAVVGETGAMRCDAAQTVSARV